MLRFAASGVFFLLAIAAAGAEQTSYEFELQPAGLSAKWCPVWIDLPQSLQQEDSFHVQGESSDQLIPCQKSEDGTRAVFVLDRDLAAGTTRRFKLIPQNVAPADAVRFVKGEESISLCLGKKVVLTYHTAIVDPPAGASPLYRRSGHIHPFVTPGGKAVTDAFPSDHLHQHGIFAAWTKTFFEGERVDFWNQMAGTGTVGHHELLEATSGPVFASFRVRLKHTVLKESPQDVVDEIWTVRLYNIPELHLFDVESVQTCVAKSPLTIAEYHYGGFAFRGASAWIRNNEHNIMTDKTTDRKEGNHSRPNWVSVYGPVEGALCGGAMFSHPANFRSPQPVRLHPSMPYFVYSPCVLGEFDLKPGEPFRSRYRYISFDGAPDHEMLDLAWKNYSAPPKIQWVGTP